MICDEIVRLVHGFSVLNCFIKYLSIPKKTLLLQIERELEEQRLVPGGSQLEQ